MWFVSVQECVCVQFIVNVLTSNVHFSVRSVILEEVILLSGPVTHTVYKQIIRLKICTLILVWPFKMKDQHVLRQSS